MNKKNLLVAASLLLLATACKENYPVVPVPVQSEPNTPGPMLIVPMDDTVSVVKSKGKPTPANVKPEEPSSAYRSDVMPKLAKDQ